MKKTLHILICFYLKTLIPGVLFSLLAALPAGLDFRNFCVAFFFIFPLMHYFIYELRLKNEYLFYANFGLSRLNLWIFIAGFSILLNLISSVV